MATQRACTEGKLRSPVPVVVLVTVPLSVSFVVTVVVTVVVWVRGLDPARLYMGLHGAT